MKTMDLSRKTIQVAQTHILLTISGDLQTSGAHPWASGCSICLKFATCLHIHYFIFILQLSCRGYYHHYYVNEETEA